jgi:hypothetical protein
MRIDLNLLLLPYLALISYTDFLYRKLQLMLNARSTATLGHANVKGSPKYIDFLGSKINRPIPSTKTSTWPSSFHDPSVQVDIIIFKSLPAWLLPSSSSSTLPLTLWRMPDSQEQQDGQLSWRLSSHPITLLCFLGFRICTSSTDHTRHPVADPLPTSSVFSLPVTCRFPPLPSLLAIPC